MYIFPTIFSYGLEYFLYELYESKTCLFGAFRLLAALELATLTLALQFLL